MRTKKTALKGNSFLKESFDMSEVTRNMRRQLDLQNPVRFREDQSPVVVSEASKILATSTRLFTSALKKMSKVQCMLEQARILLAHEQGKEPEPKKAKRKKNKKLTKDQAKKSSEGAPVQAPASSRSNSVRSFSSSSRSSSSSSFSSSSSSGEDQEIMRPYGHHHGRRHSLGHKRGKHGHHGRRHDQKHAYRHGHGHGHGQRRHHPVTYHFDPHLFAFDRRSRQGTREDQGQGPCDDQLTVENCVQRVWLPSHTLLHD